MNQTQGVCINRRAQIHQQSLCCYSPPAPGSCILPNHIQHACVDASNSLMLKAAAPFLYLHQSYRLAMYSMQADCTLNHSALLIGVHATYFLCHILHLMLMPTSLQCIQACADCPDHHLADTAWLGKPRFVVRSLTPKLHTNIAAK